MAGTNTVTVDQFISIVGGSEDLHLKAGADAIRKGLDLGTTIPNANIDIDGRDRDAEGDTWAMGAHQFVSLGGLGWRLVGDRAALVGAGGLAG